MYCISVAYFAIHSITHYLSYSIQDRIVYPENPISHIFVYAPIFFGVIFEKRECHMLSLFIHIILVTHSVQHIQEKHLWQLLCRKSFVKCPPIRSVRHPSFYNPICGRNNLFQGFSFCFKITCTLAIPSGEFHLV